MCIRIFIPGKPLTAASLLSPQTTPPRPPWQNNVVQLLVGTCGAVVDTSTPTVDRFLWHVANCPNTYYSSVVDINGSQVMVTSYSGNTGVYDVFDSFTIARAIPTSTPTATPTAGGGGGGGGCTVTPGAAWWLLVPGLALGWAQRSSRCRTRG